jgi:ABC-type multidrug transport system fused ATPase/permease subunit
VGLIASSFLVLNDELTAGKMISYMLFASDTVIYVGFLPEALGNMTKAVAASQKIFDIIDKNRRALHDTIRQPSSSGVPQELDIDDESLVTSDAPAVRFVNVNFAYPTAPERVVLHDMSFDIAAEESVALVGRSGQGKSTIISLIEQFYQPTTGRIELFGRDVSQLPLEYVRRHLVSIVPQEAVMFSDSVAANIAYGCAPYDSTYHTRPTLSSHQHRYTRNQRQRIEDAARMANAYEFIAKMPKGFDTSISGTTLSGGQKQRIAIGMQY